MIQICRKTAIFFANQLRTARLAALADAEAFDEIIHVVERLGAYLTRGQQVDEGEPSALGGYSDVLGELASGSGMGDEVPNEFRTIMTPFKALYKSVKLARNDALHQGAFARHLTRHAIELAIILEDALTSYMNPIVTDFMVQNIVYVEPWQPIGFIRQKMLENSFTSLPVSGNDGIWRFVTDIEIADYLRQEMRSKPRVKLMAHILEETSINLRLA